VSSANLRDAEDKLAAAFCSARADYERDYPTKHLIVTCTHRSVEEQQELYSHGRSKPGAIVTQVDGINHKSNHNYYPSRAIDFAIVLGGKITWQEDEYKLAGPYFKARGLIWGGDWKTFKDWPHVELPQET
jgi:peptidoglycan L-alanyl-D-glutamate endopeptidase CwlK